MYHSLFILLFFTLTTSVNITTDINVEMTALPNVTVLVENFRNNWPIQDWIETGYFSEEYINDINIHWLQYPAPKAVNYYILGTLYFIIMVIGVFGNILVIYLFFRCKTLRTPGNVLIVNLAVSDGFMLLKSPICIYNCFQRGPALGDVACRLYAFLGGLTGSVTITTLSLISLDRYYVIKFPLRRNLSDFRTKVFIAISWICGAIFSGVPSLDIGFGKFTYEGYLTTCGFDYVSDDTKIKEFIFVFFILVWVVPFSIISFSYFNIVSIVLTRKKLSTGGRESFRHIKEEETKKQEIKLAMVVFFTILLWFLSWTPYATVALLGIFNRKDLISPSVSMVPALFCKTAACMNSYVYALSHPKFQSELKRMFGNVVSRSQDGSKTWFSESQRNRSRFNQRESTDIEEVTETDVCDVPLEKIEDPDVASTIDQIEISLSTHKIPLKKQSSVMETGYMEHACRTQVSGLKSVTEKRLSKSDDDKKESGGSSEK